MAKTLLDGVNAVLQEAKVIKGDAGKLLSLTDSARQDSIDVTVKALRSLTHDLYTAGPGPKATKLEESTFSLVSGIRDYQLSSSLVRLHFPLLDETNGNTIHEYPGGYIALVGSQLQPDNYTGVPQFGAIRETDGHLYIDATPTVNEDDRLYKYRFDKEIVLELATDRFPFNDTIFHAVVEAAHQVFERKRKRDFDQAIFRQAMGRAARLLNRVPESTHW